MGEGQSAKMVIPEKSWVAPVSVCNDLGTQNGNFWDTFLKMELTHVH
jgi:hypothetical protein